MNVLVDIYCERTAMGLLNEPLNFLTNIAFLIAAFLVFKLAKEKGQLDASMMFMVGILGAIGIGSGLFHSFATGWAQLLDVFPILLFQIYFIYFYARRVIRWGEKLSAVLLAFFLMIVVLFSEMPQDIMNGSIGYVPALLFMGWLGIYHRCAGKEAPYALLGAAFIFLVSLTLRTIDNALCAAFPFGTHFVWHILNAAVLYLVMRGLIVGGSPNPSTGKRA
jgi:hypothetical protein